MRKLLVIFNLLVLIVFTNCTSEETNNSGPKKNTIGFTEETQTYLGNGFAMAGEGLPNPQTEVTLKDKKLSIVIPVPCGATSALESVDLNGDTLEITILLEGLFPECGTDWVQLEATLSEDVQFVDYALYGHEVKYDIYENDGDPKRVKIGEKTMQIN